MNDRPADKAGRSSACLWTQALLAVPVVCLSLTLCACNEQNDGNTSGMVNGRSLNVMGSIRPKADPAMIEKIRQEEAARALAEQRQAAEAQNSGQSADPSSRNLPDVNTQPISGAPGPVAGVDNTGNSSSTGVSTNIKISDPMASMQSAPTMPMPQPQAASYAGGYGAPSSSAGLIPPPPAVTLSTQAAPIPPYGGGDPYGNPYGNPYANPYANPYMNPYMQQQQQQQAQPAHPQGSMFASGGKSQPDNASADDQPKSRKPAMVVITPTGMEARSPYKQRDDLRLLFKGALSASPSRDLHEEKAAQALSKIDVGLPTESTRGNISLSPRQIDNLFKMPPLDKKLVPAIKKIQSELVQSYYRYLYAYNKFSLTQQQVAARKQEADVADSAAEKQRAASDLAQAQSDADASKDDLHAAQLDLAAVSGAPSARSIISRVSNIAPSLESLAQAEPSDSPSAKKEKESSGGFGFLGSMTSAFNMFGKSKPKESAQAAPDETKIARTQSDNGKDKKKGKKDKKAASAPKEIARATQAQDTASAQPDAAPAQATGSIAFELKNVTTTPRKSILKVSIRNSGADSFNFDPEVVSVAEGDHKLAEAAVRTEFDTTTVPPNQEVTGTITIFGRPWNDRLSVSLSEGGRTIQLHR